MKRVAWHVARRLLWTLTLVLGVTAISFVVSDLLPGDPARMIVGPQASARDVAHAREVYALDQPMPTRFARYASHLLHTGDRVVDRKRDREHKACASVGLGVHIDLGYSFYYRKPVVDLLEARIPRSFELALAAMVFQLVIGAAIGAFAATRRGSRWDEAAIGVTLLGVSAPTFLLGLLLQYVLAYRLRLLPYDGYGVTASEHLASIVLPALTLGIFGTALYARMVRDELATILRQDFIRTARAKGAGGARVLVVHALRNALVPLATLVALDFGTMVGGAIVTETLFRWPGVGQLAVEGLLNREGPIVVGCVLFTSSAVALATWTLDAATALLDPRLRTGAQDAPPD